MREATRKSFSSCRPPQNPKPLSNRGLQCKAPTLAASSIMKVSARPSGPPGESSVQFRLRSSYQPRGDQPAAIEQLVRGIDAGEKHQVLLGVTGSGKTFTMAKVIEAVNRPALVLAHNKTLAAQLYHEFKNFFPDNAVEYFVSYYDYYQPEAYVPSADLYIEKEATIN